MLRCTWCCKDTKTNSCEHCGNSHSVSDPYEQHNHEWSRKTIKTMECKVCDLEVSNEDYFAGRAPRSGKKEKSK